MKNLKRSALGLSFLIALLCLQGCEQAKKDNKAIGELRRKIFIECMELAAKNGRAGDDDVSDIVNKCDNVAFYQSNAIGG